ncbi:sulfotransferase family protein [Antrihabitans cavernicola]|uniref:Sulfotransferase family protein n=1 Tax=Antrihabitans cavernicola TaxID=2495913 RepID=A0A5A7SER2_9NOCA|nr:sulfotransferase family protein [Spelaeibacter cavernicola]KAA0024074.1 sulfotransferase family protein [Spelaeibacter cavernicola]
MPPASQQRVYLHVGLPKTGTTYLQDRLWRNRDAAQRSGLLYPGDFQQAHHHAALELQPTRYLDWVDPAHAGIWDRLVDQVRKWPRTSVISHELFATVSAERAAQVLDDLSFAEVHVVCTARDLGRQIPSVWQENIKNQHTTTFAEFVADIKRPGSAPGREPFWEFQDLPRILRTWGATVPADRVHVVTVPGRGSSQQMLWQRFTATLGVDSTLLDRKVPTGNHSLGPTQLEVLRRVNSHLVGNVAWSRYESMVKEQLIGAMIADSERGTLPSLSDDDQRWAESLAHEFIDDIAATGYSVVGDLDDLIPTRAAADAVSPPSEGEVLEATVEALSTLVRTVPLPPVRERPITHLKRAVRIQQRRLQALRLRRVPHR